MAIPIEGSSSLPSFAAAIGRVRGANTGRYADAIVQGSESSESDSKSISLMELCSKGVHVADASNASFEAYERATLATLCMEYQAPMQMFDSVKVDAVEKRMSPFCIIDGPSGRIIVNNAGHASADFVIEDRSFLDGLDHLTGPARAEKVAERIAVRMGGVIKRVETALSQAKFDALPMASWKYPVTVTNAKIEQDERYLELTRIRAIRAGLETPI